MSFPVALVGVTFESILYLVVEGRQQFDYTKASTNAQASQLCFAKRIPHEWQPRNHLVPFSPKCILVPNTGIYPSTDDSCR